MISDGQPAVAAVLATGTRMMSSRTRCGRRGSGITRTSTAQQLTRRISLACSRSAAVIPARHQSSTLSPNGRGTVHRMSGSLPFLVCTHAAAHPVRTRCCTTTHITRATIHPRDAGHHMATPAQLPAVTAPVMRPDVPVVMSRPMAAPATTRTLPNS